MAYVTHSIWAFWFELVPGREKTATDFHLPSLTMAKKSHKKPSPPTKKQTTLPPTTVPNPTETAKPKAISIPIPVITKESAAVRTPADEGISFFEGDAGKEDGDIQVWELTLEPDGSTTKEKSVSVVDLCSCFFFPP